MKRKRGRPDRSEPSAKRQCIQGLGPGHAASHPTKPLLAQYYQEVHSLRTYLVSRLPKSSKKRRRRLLQYGRCSTPVPGVVHDAELASLLDTIIVGTFNHVPVATLADVEYDISVFTQQLTETDMSILSNAGSLQQSEIVDLTVWRLFKRDTGSRRPAHLLCVGYQRSPVAANGDEVTAAPGIPGVYTCGPTRAASQLREHPWTGLSDLLGRGADRIISELLMDCGLFEPVVDSTNVVQFCGTPMSELKVVSCHGSAPVTTPSAHVHNNRTRPDSSIGLSEVRFLRHRMLYAKPSLKACGRVRYGLGQAHVLSRYCIIDSQPELMHIMQHIFPRQFGLHNVFTSSISRLDTAHQFRDYTNREEEITRARLRRRGGCAAESRISVKCPRRLRGSASSLVRSVRKRHLRCSYKALLDHYCNPAVAGDVPNRGSLALATAPHCVAAFCKAVVRRVFPPRFFGHGNWTVGNASVVLDHVHRFVFLGRFETLSLHDVVQRLRVHDIAWLIPPHADLSAKLSHSDLAKRRELLAELVYYLFDSFLIPLIRSHFHVTEAAGQRNELCYFRHDVWRAMSEPALEELKLRMLEECTTKQTSAALAQRALGVSTVRLLPKENGMRPIINLRRRIQRVQKGQLVLGRSINSVLTSTFSVLNYEKGNHSKLLDSALFSIDDVHARLQGFRSGLDTKGMGSVPLYFAKVDVKSCFDTIPQQRLMQMATDLLSCESYHITKYARATLLGGHDKNTPGFGAKPSWKFLNRATGDDEQLDLNAIIQSDTAIGHGRTAYVHGAQARLEHRTEIIDLLREHVESNVIKLGNKHYRQKEGIPQGSILSSLLCSYFYGELEEKCLAFLRDGKSLPLRLIDDFLVITTDLSVAQRFMHVMHSGLPEFGVQVKAEKSRANFGVLVNGEQIPRLPLTSDFPYCGLTINTSSLDLSKDIERRRNAKLDHSVTVEYSKIPGQTFYRKSLGIMKLQMRTMLLSTSYNSVDTVLVNIYHCFSEAAQKMLHYVKALPVSKQPPDRLIIKTVNDLIDLACVLMKRRKPSSKDIVPYACAVTTTQARWLACDAFLAVFAMRQTKFVALVAWLKEYFVNVERVVQAPDKLPAAVERYRR